VRDRTPSALQAAWTPPPPPAARGGAVARAASAHRGEPEQAQAALQAGLQARGRDAVRAVGDVRRRGRLAGRGQQLGVHVAGLGGHEQHGALDRGHDADAAAQHLRARAREGLSRRRNPATNSMARWIVETMPTLPRSTCARACEGLSRRRNPATNSMARWIVETCRRCRAAPARAHVRACPGGDTLHETA